MSLDFVIWARDYHVHVLSEFAEELAAGAAGIGQLLKVRDYGHGLKIP